MVESLFVVLVLVAVVDNVDVTVVGVDVGDAAVVERVVEPLVLIVLVAVVVDVDVTVVDVTFC